MQFITYLENLINLLLNFDETKVLFDHLGDLIKEFINSMFKK